MKYMQRVSPISPAEATAEAWPEVETTPSLVVGQRVQAQLQGVRSVLVVYFGCLREISSLLKSRNGCERIYLTSMSWRVHVIAYCWGTFQCSGF
jgi:hypothetical protein